MCFVVELSHDSMTCARTMCMCFSSVCSRICASMHVAVKRQSMAVGSVCVLDLCTVMLAPVYFVSVNNY